MSASPSSTSRAAIVSHILDAIDRDSDKELRIALLIRDAIDDVALHIVRRFVRSLSESLSELDPDMEPLEANVSAAAYCGIGWRHRAWPTGVSIRLEFQRRNFRAPSFGVCAPDAATLKGTDVEARADYVPISEELRRRIAAAVVSGSSMMGKGKPSGWWPIYTDLEHPLDSWLTEETLPIIAGIKPHESVTFVEWIARLFVEIRDALRPVLG